MQRSALSGALNLFTTAVERHKTHRDTMLKIMHVLLNEGSLKAVGLCSGLLEAGPSSSQAEATADWRVLKNVTDELVKRKKAFPAQQQQSPDPPSTSSPSLSAVSPGRALLTDRVRASLRQPGHPSNPRPVQEDGDDTHVAQDRRKSSFLFPEVMRGFETSGDKDDHHGFGSWLSDRLSLTPLTPRRSGVSNPSHASPE